MPAGALTQEDLQFLMSIDADASGITETLGQIARSADERAEETSKQLAQVTKQEKLSIEDQQKIVGSMQERISLEKTRAAIADTVTKNSADARKAAFDAEEAALSELLAVEVEMRSRAAERSAKEVQSKLVAGMSEAGAKAAERTRINALFGGLGRPEPAAPPTARLVTDREIARDQALKSIAASEKEILLTQRNLLTPAERFRQAMLDVTKELSSQEDSLTKMQVGLNPAVLDRRLGIEQEITALKHEQLLAEIKAAGDPERLRERVRQEREITEARKGLAALENKEQRRQGIPGAGGGSSTVANLLGGIFGKTGGGGVAGGIGGMAGSAAGALLPIPGGAEIGAILGSAIGKAVAKAVEVVPKILGTVLAAPARLASYGLDLLGNSLRELQGPLGPIGMGLGLLGEGLSTLSGIVKSIPLVGTILGPLSDVLAGIPNQIKGMTVALVDMVGAFSPGTMTLWQRELKNVQAAIGQSFLPVLELMTDSVRLFGTVLSNILPNAGEARSALAEARLALQEFSRAVREWLQENAKGIRESLIEGLKTLAHWMAVGAKAALLLGQRIAGLFGLGKGTGKDEGKNFSTAGGDFGPRSTGAVVENAYARKKKEDDLRANVQAAAPANMSGIEEYQRQLQLSAFSAGAGGPKASPEEKAILDLQEIEKQAKAVDEAIAAAAEKAYDFWKEDIKPVLVDIYQTLVVVKDVAVWLKNTYQGGKKALDIAGKGSDRVIDSVGGGPKAKAFGRGALFGPFAFLPGE